MAHRETWQIQTRGRSTHLVTGRVAEAVARAGISTGLATVFVHHTSASLFINENADPDVRVDLEAFFARWVRDGDPLFRHIAEGDDDMSAHIRSVVTATSLVIPVHQGALDLGTWQGIYLWEHRQRGHSRRLSVVVV